METGPSKAPAKGFPAPPPAPPPPPTPPLQDPLHTPALGDEVPCSAILLNTGTVPLSLPDAISASPPPRDG